MELAGTCQPPRPRALASPRIPGAPCPSAQHCRQVSAVLVFTGHVQMAPRRSPSSSGALTHLSLSAGEVAAPEATSPT